MKKPKSFIRTPLFLKNFIFGIEDSLVSTVGLLAGVAIADVPRGTIFLTGIVLIFVEALSMGAGSFLAEHSAEEYREKQETPARKTIIGGVVMFFSYFVAGFIPLAPYIIFDVGIAFWVSIALALITLFVLGTISARVSKVRILRHGLKMLLVGGSAVIIGIIVGSLLSGIEL